MDKKTFDWLKSPRNDSKLKKKYKKIREAFGIDMTKQTREDLYKPIISALFARALLFTIKEPIPKDNLGQAEYWKKYYNTPDGAGTDGTFLDDVVEMPPPEIDEEDVCLCVRGHRGNNGECVCIENYKGEKCDQPKCPGRPKVCSNNGKCIQATDGSKNHFCECRDSWQGDSCDQLPPTPVSGDPHLRTIDGLDFDYFDIGVYWGCISRENDFGVQLAFFQYQGTSLVGGVALKAGDGVVTIVSNGNSSSLSMLRINGTEMTVEVGDELELSERVTLFITNQTGFVIYFAQFRNGITYSIETHYSPVLGRQYLDVALGVNVVLLEKTSGLCGLMDGNTNNDLTGSNGTLHASAIDFGDSWRVELNDTSSSAGVVWSWNASNFYPTDIAGTEYSDPGHVPRYGFSGFSLSEIQNAQSTCETRGLTGTFLESCKLDILITNDSSFADQSAFQIGKCPNDCSNHGTCVNGSCICSALWTGEDCNQGGCTSCGPNSECQNGFCVCKFGYQEIGGVCTEVSCGAVNNCTSPLQGVCSGPNECLCSPGFNGSDCSQVIVCTVSCSSHGVCGEGNQCVCDPNWSGDDCSIPDCNDLQNCSGHGVCNANASCDCYPGWTGSICSSPSCSNISGCSRNGLCTSPGQCTCNQGFAPPDCSSPVICSSLSNCSGNGICLTSSSCLCYDGFAGSSCEFPLCPSGCSNQGECVGANFCECNQGWTGLSCSQPSCQARSFCSGNGVCAEFDRCVCSTNWTGPDCNVPYCAAANDSRQCSGRGTCIAPGVCSCETNYIGDLCQETIHCSDLGLLRNGSKSTEETIVGTKVKFTCDHGFELNGMEYLMCNNNGTYGIWSGDLPTCKPYVFNCNECWPVQRDQWINESKAWVKAAEECLGMRANISDFTFDFDSMSPIQQWNAIMEHFVANVGTWLRLVAPLVPGASMNFSVNTSKSLDEQWEHTKEFMNQLFNLWYSHVGQRVGFTRPSTPVGKCKNKQVDEWNDHMISGRVAREKYQGTSEGKCAT